MKKSAKVYQLKVTLQDTAPPIWRRLLVQSDITLLQLHDTLQIAMGWKDSHLHQFVAGDKRYALPDDDFDLPALDERAARLAKILTKPKDKLIYEYDFGDGWLHTVVLEMILESEPGARYPWLVTGRRACPPEDCGGTGGYHNLVEVLRNPTHPERQEILDWIGEPFDPQAFDPEETNLILHGGWAPSR